jgi:cell division transport system permease protein
MPRKKGNISKKTLGFPAAPSGTLPYFVGRAVTNFRQNLLASLLTVCTISLSLLLLALFLLVYVNLEGAADRWSDKVQVTVYFENEPSQQEIALLRTRISALAGTERVDYVSKAEAMQRFRSRLKGQEALLDGVGAEVLPASLELRLKRGYRSSEAVETYVSSLKRVPGAQEVQYGEEWVRRFNTFMNFMRFVGVLLGGFLVLAVLFIVSNTIKLTIYSRREELEIMQMVGATPFFIKCPFLIEGVIQGFSGAAIALAALGGFYLAFLHNAGNFLNFNFANAGLAFLPPIYLAALLAGGTAVGLVGSLASLRRFM